MQFTITVSDELAAILVPNPDNREQKILNGIIRLLEREAKTLEITRAGQQNYPYIEGGISGEIIV